MSQPDLHANTPAWLAYCEAHGLHPEQRLQARLALLADTATLEACLYRPDEDDPDAEEQDLGDIHLQLLGTFVAPSDWDAETLEDYFDGEAPENFFSARLESAIAPGSRGYNAPTPGDLIAVTQSNGLIQMYYLYDCIEQNDGLNCVLILEPDPF